MGEPFLFGEAVDPVIDFMDMLGGQPRHQVVRLGQREPIPPLLRALIYQRDNHTCQACGARGYSCGPQLDHVIPWSAGGPDTGNNLRTLCEICNAKRSNFHSGLDYARPLGVTPMCIPCTAAKYGDPEAVRNVPDEDQAPVWCGCCQMTSWTHPGSIL